MTSDGPEPETPTEHEAEVAAADAVEELPETVPDAYQQATDPDPR